MAWQLAGVTLPKPDKFSIGYVEIADYTRDITGKLYKDVVAKIRKFTVSFKGIDATLASTLSGIIETNTEMLFFYEYNGLTLGVTVTISQGTITRLETNTEAYQVDLTLEEV
jgi:hypothetical protein